MLKTDVRNFLIAMPKQKIFNRRVELFKSLVVTCRYAGIFEIDSMIVFMQCSTNNKANAVPECFIAAVDNLAGLPGHTDYGKENVEVARLMVEHCGLNCSSHICVPSARNQRIERLWRDYFRCIECVFSDLFVFLEDNGLLSPENNNDLFSLARFFTQGEKSIVYG